MTFSRKIFLSVFFTILAVSSLFTWIAYNYVSNQTASSYIDRYSSLSNVLGSALNRLDYNTEALMLNAVQVVAAHEAEKGLLSEAYLKDLQGKLNVTHLFIIDKDGKFIRSTNEIPAKIPNLYSFCPDYRKLVQGLRQVEATPIIHPQPEPRPFKFLSIPNRDKNRIIEVGVRIDFIAKTLTEALGSDANLISMSLYSPDGNSMGKFSSNDVQFNGKKAALPENFPFYRDAGDKIHFFTKVESSHPKCCQCDVAGTSRNGDYYYVLEAEVSKNELVSIQAATKSGFLLLALLNIVLGLGLSRVLSRRLVKNIEKAVSKVREIKKSATLNERIHLSGQDEVTFLTNEFDHLLDSLQVSQQKLVEAEKVQVKMQLAREVAHNIKSPVTAIEIMMPSLSHLPSKVYQVLADSVREIKDLSKRLKQQSEGNVAEVSSEVIFLPIMLSELVNRKCTEYSNRPEIQIVLENCSRNSSLFVKADATELKAIVSNLINNAVEAARSDGCLVKLSCLDEGDQIMINITDDGVGIPADLVEQIGKKRLTFKADSSRGIGLVHAFQKVESWGGRIDVKSKLGLGTTVCVYLPKYFDKKIDSDLGRAKPINLTH